MNIPYILDERPDTGLTNSKLGIWIFLASEVMLFGGLFSAYVFLRIAAPEGDFDYWGAKLSVPMATFNTLVLITSSVTMVMAWASLKLKDFEKYKKTLVVDKKTGRYTVVGGVYQKEQVSDAFGSVEAGKINNMSTMDMIEDKMGEGFLQEYDILP